MPGQTLDSELEFETGGEDDLEVVSLESGQEVPKEEPEKKEDDGSVTLSAEQYAEMMKGKDSTAALTEGLGRLAEGLQRPQQPINVMPQMPQFNPDEIEELAFKPKGFTEAVGRVVNQIMGQSQGPLAMGLVQQNKKLLKLDPNTSENFNLYEKEIEARVQSLPPQLRFQPDIYERAYRDVVFEKQEEITNRKAEKIAKEAVKKALEAAGITMNEEGEAQPKKKSAPALYQEGSTRPVAAASQRPKQKIYFTADDRQRMIEKGMDPDDRDQCVSYYENVIKRRAK
jgi:hypothetical protein